MTMEYQSVVLADDHAAVRGCIRRVLAHDPRIRLLGEASDYSDAIAKARELKPDVLIVDLHMPLGRGLFSTDLNRELHSCGAAKVLGISFANDDDARSLAKSLGADGLLDKVTLGTELIPAIVGLAASGNSGG